jgi:DNA repair protein RecO
MSAEKTEAVVLSVTPYGETSCILRLFTRMRGLVHGIAKGFRKGGKSASAPLDRGFLIEAFVYYKPNRELHTLSRPHVIHYFSQIRSDITKSAIRDIALELYLKTIPQSDPHPELFELMADFLIDIEESSESLFPFLWRFICRYCLLMGFGMDAKSYKNCGINNAIIKFIEEDTSPPRTPSAESLTITESLLHYCRTHFDIRTPFKSLEFVRTMF